MLVEKKVTSRMEMKIPSRRKSRYWRHCCWWGEYEDGEDDKIIQEQSKMLRLTVRNNENDYEEYDWEKEIRNHRRRIEQEEEEMSKRQELATRKKESWELLQLCREYIKENGKYLQSTSSQMEEEKDRSSEEKSR